MVITGYFAMTNHILYDERAKKNNSGNRLLSSDNIEEVFLLAETGVISAEEAVERVQLHLESIGGLVNNAEDCFANSKIGKGSLFNYVKLKPIELKKLLDTTQQPTPSAATQTSIRKQLKP